MAGRRPERLHFLRVLYDHRPGGGRRVPGAGAGPIPGARTQTALERALREDHGPGSYGTPATPTGLAFSGVTHERLTLRWDAPRNSKVSGYEITRAVGDGPAQTLAADTGSALTEYADTGLSPETTYTYRVAARNDLGSGAASGPATVTTAEPALDPDLPRPTGLTVSFDDDGRVLLDWDDPEGDAVGAITGYRILRGASADTLDLLVRDTASTATSWTDASASGGSTYFYAVRARDADSMSEVSDPVAVSVLAAPQGLAGHGTAGASG